MQGRGRKIWSAESRFFEQFTQALERLCNRGALLVCGAFECGFKRALREDRNAIADECFDFRRGMNSGDAAVGWVLPAHKHPALLEAVDDAADGGVREADFAAQILEADAMMAHDHSHGGPLRHGQVAPGDLGFKRFAQGAPDSTEVSIH